MCWAAILPEAKASRGIPMCGSTDEEQPMPNRNLTRRRVITIAASAVGSAFLTGSWRAQASEPMRWRGSAFGAQVSIEIYHPDQAEARRLVDRCVTEVRRLEQQFNLYQGDSAICTLNRTGILVSPDADMVALLKASLHFADLTDGAFDPTVQPLWQLYADHFSSEDPDPAGPPKERLAETLARVGHRALLVSKDRVALARHGAAMTLNGIAQGYATDCVVERLRDAGLSTTLVNMGEIRALGARPEGKPWRVGLADPDKPGVLTETIDLIDHAVATSAGAGFRFDVKGRFTHLFDPATGRSPSLYNTLSVVAPTATEADALSTAFSLMPVSRIEDVLAARPGVQARIMTSSGSLIVCGA
jgi:thiamine biosynthesis lipoprotein